MSASADRMQAFIDQEVTDFAAYLLAGAKARVRGRGIAASESLLRSLATETAKNQIDLIFDNSGRFHDMGAGRGYSMGKYLGRESREYVLKGRRGSLWYSRFVYGATFGMLVNNLSNKYIEQVPGLLTESFNDGQ